MKTRWNSGSGIWDLDSSWPTDLFDQFGVAQLSKIFWLRSCMFLSEFQSRWLAGWVGGQLAGWLMIMPLWPTLRGSPQGRVWQWRMQLISSQSSFVQSRYLYSIDDCTRMIKCSTGCTDVSARWQHKIQSSLAYFKINYCKYKLSKGRSGKKNIRVVKYALWSHLQSQPCNDGSSLTSGTGNA